MTAQACSCIKSRDEIYDVIKGVAIVLVVFWHVIYLPISWAERTLITNSTANFIIGCNMPIFFFVAGHFARRMHEQQDWYKCLVRVGCLVWPLLAFVMLRVLAEGRALDMSFGVYYIRYCIFNQWFICGLIFCELLTMVSFMLSNRFRVPLVACLSCLLLIRWLMPWGLWYSMAMLPFYWMGLSASLARFAVSGRCLVVIVISVVYLIASIHAGDVTKNGIGFYWDKMSILEFTWSGFQRMIMRYVFGMMGIVTIATFARVIMRVSPLWKALASFGTTTLGVYLLHPMLFPMFVPIHSVAACFVEAVCVLIVAHCLILFVRQSRFLNILFFGPFAKRS